MKNIGLWFIACLFAFITGIAVERNTCSHAKALAELKDCVLHNRKFQIGTNTVMQFRAFTEDEVLSEADAIRKCRERKMADFAKRQAACSGFSIQDGLTHFQR